MKIALVILALTGTGLASVVVLLRAVAAAPEEAAARERMEEQLLTLAGRLAQVEQDLRSGLASLRQDQSRSLAAREPEHVPHAGGARAGEDLAPAGAALAAAAAPVTEQEQRMLDAFAALTGETKQDAVGELAELARWGNARALELIVESLTDADEEVREEAVEALGELASPELIGHLDAMRGDPSERVREEVAEALRELPAELAGPVLAKMLGDASPGVVRESLQALRASGYRSAMTEIRELAQGSDLEIVAEAARTLFELGDAASGGAALDRLARGLSDPDPLGRINAIRHLRRVGGEQAIAYLEGVVANDDNLTVRMEAQEALERLR